MNRKNELRIPNRGLETVGEPNQLHITNVDVSYKPGDNVEVFNFSDCSFQEAIVKPGDLDGFIESIETNPYYRIAVPGREGAQKKMKHVANLFANYGVIPIPVSLKSSDYAGLICYFASKPLFKKDPFLKHRTRKDIEPSDNGIAISWLTGSFPSRQQFSILGNYRGFVIDKHNDFDRKIIENECLAYGEELPRTYSVSRNRKKLLGDTGRFRLAKRILKVT